MGGRSGPDPPDAPPEANEEKSSNCGSFGVLPGLHLEVIVKSSSVGLHHFDGPNLEYYYYIIIKVSWKKRRAEFKKSTAP